jgi:cell division GTPase FtsZ
MVYIKDNSIPMEVISNSRAASDTRHRIQQPNSRPRLIKVVGIGAGGAGTVKKLNGLTLRNVQPVIAPGACRSSGLPEQLLEAIRSQGVDLDQSLKGADEIFIVAHADDDVGLAPVIRHIGRQANVMITGILFQSRAQDAKSAGTLEVLRAASDMLIVASDDGYLIDMLEELGA